MKVPTLILLWGVFVSFLHTRLVSDGIGGQSEPATVALGTFIETLTSWVLVLGQIFGCYEAGICLVL